MPGQTSTTTTGSSKPPTTTPNMKRKQTPIYIRLATPRDLPRLKEVEQSANRRHFDGDTYSGKLSNWNYTKESEAENKRAVGQNLLWVATVKTSPTTTTTNTTTTTPITTTTPPTTKIVGFISTKVITEPQRGSSGERYLYIDGLYIMRSYQGHGIGSRLLGFIEGYASNARDVTAKSRTNLARRGSFDYLSLTTQCGEQCAWHEPYYQSRGFVTVPRDALLDCRGRCTMPGHAQTGGHIVNEVLMEGMVFMRKRLV